MNKTLKNTLDKLANFTPTASPFISLYLNTQSNQHGRDDFESFVRKEFSEHARSFKEDSPELKSFEHDRYWINEFFVQKLRPSANGVAIFACAGVDNFFEVIQFDAPIEEHSMNISNSPHLFPLARLVDQNPRHIALVADTNEARLFVFDPGATKSVQLIRNSEEDSHPSSELSKLQYKRWSENKLLMRVKNIVSRLELVVKNEGVGRIILAGDEVIIPLLKDQMPRELADKLVDVLSLDIRTPEHEILKATTEALFDHNIQTDAESVRELFDKYRSGGLAVVGLEDTLDALSKGQVDELVLSASLNDISVESSEVRKVPSITAASNTPSVIQETESSANVVDRLVSRALLTKASINFIEDPMLLSEIGGIGAFLRYKDYKAVDKSTVRHEARADLSYAN